MKILLVDIETSPNSAFVWGLWQQNVGLSQLIESSEVLCWSAKWYGEKEVHFDSLHKSDRYDMLGRIHNLLSQADAVVSYNGIKFDLPTLNKEFLLEGFHPPAPYKQIDLLRVARQQFRFPSNKLDYVAQALGLGKKKETNFKLWIDCMNKDPKAWEEMETYNKHDVVLLEKVYDRLRPWIKSAANFGLHSNTHGCPICGSSRYHRRGLAYTQSYSYARYQCLECGKWFRGSKNIGAKVAERFLNIP